MCVCIYIYILYIYYMYMYIYINKIYIIHTCTYNHKYNIYNILFIYRPVYAYMHARYKYIYRTL